MDEVEDLKRRLKEAIKDRGSIRKFQREMEKTGVRGHSRQMIHAYLSGEREPSIAFLRKAAEVLGVREAWLMAGSGRKTPAASAFLAGGRDRLGRTDEDSVGDEFDRRGLSPAVQALLNETAEQYGATAKEFEEIDEELAQRMVREISLLLSLPRHLWGFHRFMDAETLNEYTLAMLQALRIALLPPRSIDLADHRDSRIHHLWGATYYGPTV